MTTLVNNEGVRSTQQHVASLCLPEPCLCPQYHCSVLNITSPVVCNRTEIWNFNTIEYSKNICYLKMRHCFKTDFAPSHSIEVRYVLGLCSKVSLIMSCYSFSEPYSLSKPTPRKMREAYLSLLLLPALPLTDKCSLNVIFTKEQSRGSSFVSSSV